MFGILEKMDKFSSAQMSEGEQLNFIQELIDNNMVWEMHKKYRDQAEIYLNADSALLPEKISFTQEIINNGLVWDMHQKYIAQASEYLSDGQCHYAFMENMVNPAQNEAVK